MPVAAESDVAQTSGTHDWHTVPTQLSGSTRVDRVLKPIDKKKDRRKEAQKQSIKIDPSPSSSNGRYFGVGEEEREVGPLPRERRWPMEERLDRAERPRSLGAPRDRGWYGARKPAPDKKNL